MGKIRQKLQKAAGAEYCSLAPGTERHGKGSVCKADSFTVSLEEQTSREGQLSSHPGHFDRK